jgi:hypothetical protein
LQRRFKEAFGVSPRDYQDAHRVEAVKSSLQNGRRVADAVFDAGYGSVSRFYEKPLLGMNARDYRAKGKGQRISAARSLILGSVLIAATDKGLCSVKLGDDAERLERLLAEEFSAPKFRTSDLKELKAKILALSKARRASPAAARYPRHGVPAPRVGRAAPDFRAARPARISRSPAPSARRPRCVRSAAPAAPTRWRLPCPATAPFAPTAAWAATPGDCSASGSSARWKRSARHAAGGRGATGCCSPRSGARRFCSPAIAAPGLGPVLTAELRTLIAGIALAAYFAATGYHTECGASPANT